MKRTVGRLVLALSLTALIMGPPNPAQSLTTSFDVINFKPAIDSTRFITMYDGETHKSGEWNVGFYLDFAHHPLELAAPIGTRRQGVVDDTIVMDIFGSYGITDWFEIGALVPVVIWNNYQGLVDALANRSNPFAGNEFSLGDVQLAFKFRLLNHEKVGLAIIPYANFPTGKSTIFNGNGTVTGGARLALHVDPHRRVRLGLNVDYLNRTDVLIRNARVDDWLGVGVGINVKAHNRFDIIAEGTIKTVIKEFFENEVETPAEVDGAFRVHATKNLDVTVGGGAGLTVGVGSPDFRAFLGLNYTHHKEEAAPRAPEIKAKKITIDQMIHFDFDKSVIKKDSYAILNDVASILKANPQIKKIRIEGHTDSIGSDAYNMKLSQRRANSTRDYLVKQGIDPSRLEAVGYGESRPIAPNNTAAGRAKNRRSEFNVIEQ